MRGDPDRPEFIYDFAGLPPDPDDPSVPYSQQRKWILDLLEAGLAAGGETGSARVILDVYAAECFDYGRLIKGPNIFWLGRIAQAAAEAALEAPLKVKDEAVE